MSEILISSKEELDNGIKENMACLVYFSSPTCNVCQVLRPKIMEEFEKHYKEMKLYHVDLSITPEIGSELQVLAAPTVIIYLEGREFIRKYRNMSVDGLLQEVQRPYSMMMES
jgi:thioredoxin 1